MDKSNDKPGQVEAEIIAAARRSYFASGGSVVDPRVRPSVLRSWKRSLACRIAPDQGILTVTALPRIDRTVFEVVEFVVNEFVDMVGDVDGVVTFTDSNGTLSLVQGSTPKAQRMAGQFPVGAQVLEEIVGTTSDGIVIEERQPAQVWSGEHVLDLFQGYCCSSVPVLDPVSRALIGVLTLTVSEDVARRVGASALLLMVSGYTWRIQMHVEKATIPSESQLLHDFLREYRKRGNEFVIASNAKVVIASLSYLTQASKYDLDVVLGVLRSGAQRDPSPKHVASSEGAGFSLNIREVADSAGVIATLKPDAVYGEQAVVGGHGPVLKDLVGANNEFLKAVRSGSLSVRQFEPLIFAGEFGVGKATIAAAIAKDLQLELHKFDCANGVGDVQQFLAHVPAHGPRHVLLVQHVELLEQDGLARLVSLVRQIPSVSLICTAENRINPLLIFSAKNDVNFIFVPSLRRRRDDISLLIDHFMEGAPVGVSKSLRSTFISANWPGNIQQLRKVLAYATDRNTGEDLTIHDLDETDRRLLSHGRLTRLEEAELDQIRGAIFEAKGNKSLAATLLEIGRSTLYRRVDYFRRRGFDVGAPL
ncbi:transcriptional regulator of acetoin/glycerol metabolism [Paenarthrobacter nitroguajacolicus]|uniref:helix-turn-helix domain-containing protein n=1 Tax=Paenarthrobacter nitroguajacolicus TaxID=211146 RepID=UPI0028611B2C|nr:helix-turn-helix domain-containing protein [Paenarthrobacter nitroguajacolicus]MDR6989156.1 transcriptional regulator of acetoin/glycerol metabolism [Paenarthrobacter nitroguajacolicus]